MNSDPLDVALELAGQVSAPAAARALRQALCAERLTEQTSIRGVLRALDTELGSTPVALLGLVSTIRVNAMRCMRSATQSHRCGSRFPLAH